ncbi:MAG TPA: glycerophosphodiester phosphodiesterase [Gemmatimonadaceae bacterium]|nr:glycerophosphodiester phosphodiesterase [Gemmatimonadaceae bacterium]
MPVAPLRIAHRGMPRRLRENTLPSFAEALAHGAQGIELDVHATADGVVVVHHDARAAHGLEIARTEWEELQRDAADGTGIPTLESVCELVGDRAELFVEIKGAAIEEPVLQVLGGHTGPIAIHSFDHPAIGRIAKLEPAIRLGLLFEDHVPDVAAVLSAHGARDAWPHHSLVDARMIDEVHATEGRVIVWTVNAARDVRRVTALGVDGICTDDVTLLDAR